MIRKKKKIKYKNIILVMAFCLFSCMLIFSLVNIIKWLINADKTKDITNEIIETVNIVETDDNNKVEIVNQPEVKMDDPYWNYIKMNLIDVDFSKLKSVNNNVVGWIQVNGTNINYPFVRTDNNEFYLSHSFDKSYNVGGWIFMDYRNNISSLDKNTILYGHGMYNKTMFGSLKNILSSNWYSDSNNYIVKLSTEYENSLWQVFSVYKIPNTSDYITTSFSSDNEYTEFLDLINKRSYYNFNVVLNSNDKVLTLSTCYDDYQKVVMHAKLIKIEKK